MSELSERLAALSGADRECDLACWRILNPTKILNRLAVYRLDEMPEDEFDLYLYEESPVYTYDLNPVIAEIERRGWNWAVDHGPGAQPSGLVHSKHHDFDWIYAPTPCLALLRALIAAVEAERAATTQREMRA